MGQTWTRQSRIWSTKNWPIVIFLWCLTSGHAICTKCTMHLQNGFFRTVLGSLAFSALTLLVVRQEGHPACKKQWWGAGVVICLERGADLHTVCPSCSHFHSLSFAPVKSRLVLHFWYRLTQVVLENRPLNGCSVVLGSLGLCNGRSYVCPSIHLSHCTTAASACDGFAANPPRAGHQGHQSIAAGAGGQQQRRRSPALSSKCGQQAVSCWQPSWLETAITAVAEELCDALTSWNLSAAAVVWWLGSRVVSVLDSGAEGPGFKSQPRCCRVTVLGKLFTPIVPLFTK